MLTRRGKTLEEIDSAFHSHAAQDEVRAKQMVITSICAGAAYQPSWSAEYAKAHASLDTIDGKPKGNQEWVESV